MRVEAVPVLTNTWHDCMISICVFIYMFIWGGLFVCFKTVLLLAQAILQVTITHVPPYLSLVSLACAESLTVALCGFDLHFPHD